MIWFTADQHFGHANIIKYCNRPYANVDAMDERLIDCWNSAIGAEDTVYHLGDFTLGDEYQARRYFRQLSGKIFVLGTAWHHDRFWLPNWNILNTSGKFSKVGQANFFSATHFPVTILPPLHVLELEGLGDGKYPLAITLCHYPLARWDRGHYGAWHLYGHVHGQYENGGRSLDVGVDANDYAPIGLDEVTELLRDREINQAPLVRG